MQRNVGIAVAGYGLVGRRHVQAIEQCEGAKVVAVVEPENEARNAAAAAGYRVFADLEAIFSDSGAEGVILATPNAVHVSQATTCVARGIPVLIEKPIATRAADAAGLVDLAARMGVAVLVGHHRRYNPLISAARTLIAEGAIGEIRAVQATCWLYKPDSYFEAAPWRNQRGGGPIAINLVHDIDLLRHLCGEVASVRAVATASRRGGDNEDVASALLEFESGAIGTVSVSDSIAAPWSWEMTAQENPVYPRTHESCYLIGGSHGSLSLPDLRVWRHTGGQRDWWSPISAEAQIRAATDPLVNQIAHFAEVIRGRTEPLVSGLEGLRTLQVIEAIQRAASSGTCIALEQGASEPAAAIG